MKWAVWTTFLVAVHCKTVLFPVPQRVEWAGYGRVLAEPFAIGGGDHAHLCAAVERYLKLMKRERWRPLHAPADHAVSSNNALLHRLVLEVQDSDAVLDIGVDESYTLSVPSSGDAKIHAATWVGALRGLETFSQLVESRRQALVVHAATIEDWPTYGHRGLLLDTARQFYPVSSILRTLDALSFHKMNVLHWHITDSQSWPLHLVTHPELALYGAYSHREIYYPSDIRRVIQYAQERGIRVMVELDMPAHTASIGAAHPEFITCADKFWAAYAAEPPAGQLHPLREDVYQLVKDIVTEATATFPDTLYHTGGDEINRDCWTSVPEIQDFLQTHNKTADDVWHAWTDRLLHYVIAQRKKRPVVWEDSIPLGKYPQETVVQVWTTPAQNITALGYDVIVTNFDYFYLDCGHGGWVGNDERYISPAQRETTQDTFNYGGSGGSWCAPFKTWQRIYSYDMTQGDSVGKVLGGEVAMWSEQTNHYVLEGRLWPRTAAAAELFWSGSYDVQGQRRTLKEVGSRFHEWSYRIQTRGIRSEPTQPKWCVLHPGQCDLHE